MGIMQIAMLSAGVLVVLLLIIFAFAGPSEAKAKARRLDKVKYRHSGNADVQVEAQMKKALSARRKTTRPKGDTMTKMEILAIRLEKTGKGWPLSYFFYAVGGLSLVMFGLLFFKGAPILLCISIGLLVGAGLPHFVVRNNRRGCQGNWRTCRRGIPEGGRPDQDWPDHGRCAR